MSTADRPNDVLVLPRGGRIGTRQSARAEALRATVRRLDELADSLQQFSPRASWSAHRCMIASTSFRIRLTGMRRRLDDLITGRLLGEQDGARWSLEIHGACLEAERKMHDIDVCLHRLQRVDSSLSEREPEVKTFAASRSELLAVLSEIRHLIAQRIARESYES